MSRTYRNRHKAFSVKINGKFGKSDLKCVLNAQISFHVNVDITQLSVVVAFATVALTVALT